MLIAIGSNHSSASQSMVYFNKLFLREVLLHPHKGKRQAESICDMDVKEEKIKNIKVYTRDQRIQITHANVFET